MAGGTRTRSSVQSAVGIGYRSAIAQWTRANLYRFDVLEVTVDHYIHGGPTQRKEILDLVDRIPLTAHGVGLSLGTDVPLDLAYLDEVASIVDRLEAPAYSEHLAFTRVPGRDLANLLPLPRTKAVAELIIDKVRTVQSRISVPFLLENISYVFEWPDFGSVGCRIPQPDLPRNRRPPPARCREPLSECFEPRLRSLRFCRRAFPGTGARDAHGRRGHCARSRSAGTVFCGFPFPPASRTDA